MQRCCCCLESSAVRGNQVAQVKSSWLWPLLTAAEAPVLIRMGMRKKVTVKPLRSLRIILCEHPIWLSRSKVEIWNPPRDALSIPLRTCLLISPLSMNGTLKLLQIVRRRLTKTFWLSSAVCLVSRSSVNYWTSVRMFFSRKRRMQDVSYQHHFLPNSAKMLVRVSRKIVTLLGTLGQYFLAPFFLRQAQALHFVRNINKTTDVVCNFQCRTRFSLKEANKQTSNINCLFDVSFSRLCWWWPWWSLSGASPSAQHCDHEKSKWALLLQMTSAWQKPSGHMWSSTLLLSSDDNCPMSECCQ